MMLQLALSGVCGQVASIASKVATFLEHRRWHGSAYAAMLTFCADHPEVGVGLVRSIWSSAQQVGSHHCACELIVGQIQNMASFI